MKLFDHTQSFKPVGKEPMNEARRILVEVYAALSEKGYNPTSQLTGYILSGDPTYITSHKGARKLISRLDRDDLLEELVNHYFGLEEEKRR